MTSASPASDAGSPRPMHGGAAAAPGPVGADPETAKLASFPAFDWLRIVLASVVVLGHEDVPMPGPIGGGLAVDIFFALSGWLIGGILLRTARAEMPRFFFNRATRIWLPYAVAIFLLYGFAALYQGVNGFWAKYLFYDTTFTHQFFTHFPRATHELPLGGSGNQFWSIAVEEQFYLFAPIVMMLVPGGKRLWPWLVLAAVAFAFGLVGAPITLGVIAAIVRRDAGDWHARPGARWLVRLAAAGLLALLFVWDVPPLRGLFAIAVVLALAVPGVRRPLPVFLGGISYPVYLNHWIGAFAGHAVTRHLPGAPAVAYVPIAYTVSLLTGAALYLLVDRPVLLHRQSWFTRRRGRALGAVAYSLVAIGVAGGLAIG